MHLPASSRAPLVSLTPTRPASAGRTTRSICVAANVRFSSSSRVSAARRSGRTSLSWARRSSLTPMTSETPPLWTSRYAASWARRKRHGNGSRCDRERPTYPSSAHLR
jgi:hypothetical protein